MNGKNLTLLEVMGIKIKVNISWLFIALLLSWALANGYFPTVHEGLTQGAYWWMAIVAVIGLFFSITVHELGHSVVARSFGIEIKGITLWMLGGMAEMADEPPSPRAEFMMAIAGPITSALLALMFYALGAIFGSGANITPIGAVFGYLAALNLILAIFNLVPAFPLDGGRVARAIIWARTGDYLRATNIAARMGSFFGLFLIGYGLFAALAGAGFGAIWWIIIGMFVRMAADSSRFQLQTKLALKGRLVRDYMTLDPIAVSPNINVADLIDNWVYKYSFEFFPVVDAGSLIGSVSLKEVRQVPADQRITTMVGEIMVHCSPENTIGAASTTADALVKMQKSGISQLLISEDGSLVGVIALKDLMKLVAITAELNKT